MIYVASPYSHPDPYVMHARYENVKAFTAQLMRDGIAAYSPIVHGHDIATSHELPTDWEFWKSHCFAMLRKADLMIVHCIEGWDTSHGVRAEIEFCEQAGITIEYRYEL